MTATTMSSLMSCVSTLLPSCKLPGDGGGVKSGNAVGFSDIEDIDFRIFAWPVATVDDDEEVSSVCDRLTRLGGGFSEVSADVGVGLGGDRWEPRDCGSWTPRLCKLRETRRVE